MDQDRDDREVWPLVPPGRGRGAARDDDPLHRHAARRGGPVDRLGAPGGAR
jgi:hypothetical protein